MLLNKTGGASNKQDHVVVDQLGSIQQVHMDAHQPEWVEYMREQGRVVITAEPYMSRDVRKRMMFDSLEAHKHLKPNQRTTDRAIQAWREKNYMQYVAVDRRDELKAEIAKRLEANALERESALNSKRSTRKEAQIENRIVEAIGGALGGALNRTAGPQASAVDMAEFDRMKAENAALKKAASKPQGGKPATAE